MGKAKPGVAVMPLRRLFAFLLVTIACYAPACALAAIIAPDLLIEGGQVQMSLANPKLLAALGATLYYLVRRNMLETIVVGMLFFTVLRLYFH